jgi:hypothetical protein
MSDAPWLLLLFSLPAGSGTARVGVWRKLKKSGALPFKTSAYLLPNRPDLVERFQWLAQQVKDAGGEATLLFVTELEGFSREEMVRQFNEGRTADYAELSTTLNELIARHRKKPDETLQSDLEKIRRRFEEIRLIDFFTCPAGETVLLLIERAAALPESRRKPGKAATTILDRKQYARKIWLTRPQPAIDRVGSAWLITRHIDAGARFVFSADPATHPSAIPFDMTGVEFTHHGDDCTFETLLKRFAIKDRILGKIGQMIHDADLEDGKFQTVEAYGLDRVFKGLARLGVCDAEILVRGFPCFDALYQFLKSQR